MKKMMVAFMIAILSLASAASAQDPRPGQGPGQEPLPVSSPEDLRSLSDRQLDRLIGRLTTKFERLSRGTREFLASRGIVTAEMILTSFPRTVASARQKIRLFAGTIGSDHLPGSGTPFVARGEGSFNVINIIGEVLLTLDSAIEWSIEQDLMANHPNWDSTQIQEEANLMTDQMWRDIALNLQGGEPCFGGHPECDGSPQALVDFLIWLESFVEREARREFHDKPSPHPNDTGDDGAGGNKENKIVPPSDGTKGLGCGPANQTQTQGTYDFNGVTLTLNDTVTENAYGCSRTRPLRPPFMRPPGRPSRPLNW